jgi:hypothetical protein
MAPDRKVIGRLYYCKTTDAMLLAAWAKPAESQQDICCIPSCDELEGAHHN